MLDSKYYYENTAGIILSNKGRKLIQNILKDNKIKCPVCKADMVLISMNDGDSICCPLDMYGHKSGFRVKFDSQHIAKPSVLHGEFAILNFPHITPDLHLENSIANARICRPKKYRQRATTGVL